MQLTTTETERFENHSELSRFEPHGSLRFVTAAEEQLALVTDDRFHGSSFLLVLVNSDLQPPLDAVSGRAVVVLKACGLRLWWRQSFKQLPLLELGPYAGWWFGPGDFSCQPFGYQDGQVHGFGCWLKVIGRSGRIFTCDLPVPSRAL